jgi:hypothetical protein
MKENRDILSAFEADKSLVFLRVERFGKLDLLSGKI